MAWQVLIAHAEGEEAHANKLEGPIQYAGYEVVHRGTVMVGESFTEVASRVLSAGGPVVLCGTVRAMGTGWAHRLVNAARQNYQSVRVFVVKMEQDAYVQSLSLDSAVADHHLDPAKAARELIASLNKYYPLVDTCSGPSRSYNAERRYRDLALKSWHITDLVNLPDIGRSIGIPDLNLRELYVPPHVLVEASSLAITDVTNSAGLERSQKAFQQGKSPIAERRPLSEFLNSYRRLVVLGDTGMGKSTMIRWLADAYLLKHAANLASLDGMNTLPDEDWLPVVIRCRDIDPSVLGGCIDDLLLQALEKLQIDRKEIQSIGQFLLGKLEKGELILLIDGLDEIADLLSRSRFYRQIEQIHLAYNELPIVVTSRSAGYKEVRAKIGYGFKHVTLADLSPKDKESFAWRWQSLAEEDPKQRQMALYDMLQYIYRSERIKRITGNPMLLTTLALVNHKVGKLPRHRVDLYREGVLVLLNSRDGILSSIGESEAFPQLEYLAYAMCERNVEQLREDEIIELLEQMRKEYDDVRALHKHTAEDFLHLVERRTGLLVEACQVYRHGRPVSLFEFRHSTFQEYFASLALIEGRYPGRSSNASLAGTIESLVARVIVSPAQSNKPGNGEAADVIEEPEVSEKWSEVLRLCVTNCSEVDVADVVLRAILIPQNEKDSALTSRPRAVLAALCLTDEPNVSQEAGKAVLEEFAKQVGPRDGSARIGTGLDAAAMQLAKSRRWGEHLDHSLKEECRKRDKTDPTISNLIGLCGMVSAALTRSNLTSDSQPEPLGGGASDLGLGALKQIDPPQVSEYSM